MSESSARPGWGRLIAEAPALARLLAAQVRFPRRAENLGSGRTVMVLPGFLASDLATGWFRRSIAVHGFRVYGWERGLNRGADPAKFARLLERIDQIREIAGKPIALVGWSLGGIYARELAIQRPEAVSAVVTLGSPFSRSLRLNNAVKLYEAINDHPVDHPPVPLHMHAKPAAHTVAIWSGRDGVVAPAAARGKSDEADERIELHCRHNELVGTAAPVAAVLDVLARWAAGELAAAPPHVSASLAA